DPRAFGSARLARQLRRRSLDLPLASRAADFDVPLQPRRIRNNGQPSARSAAQARTRNRSADPVALPARSRAGGVRIRPARTRPFQPAAAVVARTGRIGFGLDLDSGPARRPDTSVRNAASATVTRLLGPAGRPHAHAHGAVRFAGAEPAAHTAAGGPG